ncbi:MAG: acyl-CoA thioesterase [Halorhodospira sp.]
MRRLEIELPAHLPFTTTIPVRTSDVNYGGHLAHDALVSVLHEARIRCLGAHGLTEGDCGGPGMVVTELAVAYHAEAFYADPLRIGVGVGDLGRAAASFYYRVEHAEEGREIARARTGMAFFDFTTRRPRRTPEAFRAAFAEG